MKLRPPASATLTVLSLSAFALALPATLRAADSDAPSDTSDTLEEVLVTATKDSREIDKVPISISAYTQEMMDERGIQDINDIVAQTPGLDLGDQGSNGTGDRISIRGIDSNSGASTTGVYIDDTPLQSRSNPVNLAGTVFPHVFDLERVEVLRGPQGTLFGAGAEGGVVRFITPQPSLNKESVYARDEFSMTQSGTPSYEAGAAWGGPLVDNTLGVRVSGWYRHDGGWVDRTSWQTGETFRNANWTDSGGSRLALLWKPSDAVNITPSVLFQSSHDNDTPDYWSYLSDPGSHKFVNGYGTRQQSTEQFFLPSLKIEVDMGSTLFTSISSYFYRNETNVSDVTNYDIPGSLGAVGANGEDNFFPTVASGDPVQDLFIGATRQFIVTQELRLQSNDPGARVRWVGGLYYQNSRLRDSQVNTNPQIENLFDEQQGAGAFDDYFYTDDCVGTCTGLLPGGIAYEGVEHSRDRQMALFGNVDWSITQRLILNAGLRVEKTKSNFVAAEDGPVNNGQSVGGGSADATPVTPKLGLSFQQDDATLYYGSVAKGYRPGGGNSHVPAGACGDDEIAVGLDPSAPVPNYKSDSTWSYELGTKQRYAGGRFSLDASVFYIDWKDVQWYYFLPDCGYGIVFNLGKAASKGFDLELNGKLTSNLIASMDIGYTNAKFTQTNTTYPGSVYDGQTLGQAPWTVYTSLEYRFAMGEASGFYARITDDFKSANNGPYLYQEPNSPVEDDDLQPGPSSNQLDLRFGRKWSGIDLSLFVENVLDATPRFVNPQATHYVGYDFNTEDSVSSPIFSYTTLRPRTIGLTATFNF
ncbi:MAG TPA: TonB-dependent receptor [Steroidobacteraceae bacterium]|nr:TonB-dependent receptor [Steroidobacteraceae bacterium]